MNLRCLALPCTLLLAACTSNPHAGGPPPLQPRVVTEPVLHDTDDPAIWIHPTAPEKSLIVGTDKDSDGALYVFDLGGRIVQRVGGLKRPNNVDIVQGFVLGGQPVDLAIATEREAQRLRAFRLPDMASADRGDLVVFNGDTNRAPMGIALYRRPRDGALFAIVGGKSGPAEGYLAQYRLSDDGTGNLKMELVRQFGRYSGKKEIESIAVDAELGYVYYSDETVGVHKYAADPDAPDAGKELALFGTTGYASDHEGISIYKLDAHTGYLLVSDQQANRFRVYRREGEPGNPHEHVLLKTVPVATLESDGSEVTSRALGPRFPHGLFVAMTNGRVFHYYAWEDIAGGELKLAPPATAAGR
jgi:3-phytase